MDSWAFKPRLLSGGLERRGLPTWLLGADQDLLLLPSRPWRGKEPCSRRWKTQALQPQLKAQLVSRYPGHENGVRVEGAVLGAGSLLVAPSLVPSLGSSISRRLYLNISFVQGRS